MSWKDSLEGLEDFSNLADARARKIASEKAQVIHENQREAAELTDEYRPLVEEVYKYFAQKTGGRYRDEKIGDTLDFYIDKVADIQDFERRVVFPEARIIPPWGVMVELPLMAEESSNRCRQLLEMREGSQEGFYEYRRQDKEGGWLNSKGYFIPFDAFSRPKLAQKHVIILLMFG